MLIKFLGAHHAESKQTRLVSFLIDQVLAVDAGCLASELTFSQQKNIKAILLSHGHYDHIKGVPSFIFSNLKLTTKVFATSQTLKILSTHLFDGVIYPKFTGKISFLEKPPIKLVPIEPGIPIDVEGYQVLALPVTHINGSVCFEITSKEGKKIFYSGDTGPGLSSLWKDVSPQLLIIDVTFPNRFEQTAKDAAHLCPKMLKKELREFRRVKGYLPHIIAIHVNPKLEDEIKEEIEAVAKELQHPIDIAFEGMELVI